MNEGHHVMLNFLQALRHARGPAGAIELCAFHWMPGTRAEKGIIATRGFCAAGALDFAGQDGHRRQPPAETGTPGCPRHAAERRWDGAVAVGEMVTFSGIASRTGFVHLFNLGTSGCCHKLAPSMEYPDNRVAAGERFELPSERLLDAGLLDWGGFQVREPVSSECGHPDRILVLITDEDVDIQIEDLHPNLAGGDLLTRSASRGPGFSDPARADVAKLFRMPAVSWDYGLLEMETLPHR